MKHGAKPAPKATPPQPSAKFADLEFASANQQLEGFSGKITEAVAHHEPNRPEIAAAAKRRGAQVPSEENRKRSPAFPPPDKRQ